jgi:hypothetical protein
MWKRSRRASACDKNGDPIAEGSCASGTTLPLQNTGLRLRLLVIAANAKAIFWSRFELCLFQFKNN